MSGSNALAAAKRRRGQSGGYANNIVIDNANRNAQQQEVSSNNQPITPMGILTQHHIRLREIDTHIRGLGETTNNSEFDEMVDRLNKLEQQVFHPKDESVITLNKTISKFEASLGKIESSVKEINNFIIELKAQSESEVEEESEEEETVVSAGPTFGS